MAVVGVLAIMLFFGKNLPMLVPAKSAAVGLNWKKFGHPERPNSALYSDTSSSSIRAGRHKSDIGAIIDYDEQKQPQIRTAAGRATPPIPHSFFSIRQIPFPFRALRRGLWRARRATFFRPLKDIGAPLASEVCQGRRVEDAYRNGSHFPPREKQFKITRFQG